jgi:hypothetical protein
MNSIILAVVLALINYHGNPLKGMWRIDSENPIVKNWNPYKLQEYSDWFSIGDTFGDTVMVIDKRCHYYYCRYELRSNMLIIADDTATVHKFQNDSLIVSNFFHNPDTVLYVKKK